MQQRDCAVLLQTFASRECPEDWAVAEGTVVRGAAALTWELPLPSTDAAEIMVLRPIDKCQELHGAELAELRRYNAALADAGPTPRKFYRLKLAGGAGINACDSLPQEDTDHPRTSLVRIQSSTRRRAGNGTVETFLWAAYGFVRHLILCQGPTGPVALAYVQLIISQRDRTGRYGIPEDRRDMHVFS